MTMNKTEYLLTKLQEECAEVSQRAAKGIAFTLERVPPEFPEKGSNLDILRSELMDLDIIKELLEEELGESLDVQGEALEVAAEYHRRVDKVNRYMALSKQLGTLD